MKLNYNVTGSERKSLVGAISATLNVPIKYLGAPTFVYEIGGYHIDKTGTLTGPDNLDLEDSLHQVGFDADGESREYDEPDTYESGLGKMGALEEVPDIDQHHPGQYAKPCAPITDAMQKQLDDVLDFEALKMDWREELGLGRTRRESFQGENGMQESDVLESVESDKLTIEMPLAFMTDEGFANLEKLIASKAELIKKALGVDALPVERTETTLKFPWFRFPAESSEVVAYSRFIGALCATAKRQKRVTAKEKEADNEKYTFRCFLLRLGFIGDEYKQVRKILLKNLSGSSAFKSGQKKDFSQDDLKKAEFDPDLHAEIKANLGGTEDEQ